MRITDIAQQGVAKAHTAYTQSYCTCDRSASKRSVCLAEWYNSLSLERAREKYAADIYGLLGVFSVLITSTRG